MLEGYSVQCHFCVCSCNVSGVAVQMQFEIPGAVFVKSVTAAKQLQTANLLHNELTEIAGFVASFKSSRSQPQPQLQANIGIISKSGFEHGGGKYAYMMG